MMRIDVESGTYLVGTVSNGRIVWSLQMSSKFFRGSSSSRSKLPGDWVSAATGHIDPPSLVEKVVGQCREGRARDIPGGVALSETVDGLRGLFLAIEVVDDPVRRSDVEKAIDMIE
jgi:hypothetical protein